MIPSGSDEYRRGYRGATQVRGWTPVHYASLKGWTETTRVLLDSNKALVNVKTPGDKKTPLDLAVNRLGCSLLVVIKHEILILLDACFTF